MKRYFILTLGVILFCSCGKFLEEFSQDLAYAESCADLDEILIGNGYMEQPLYFAEASVYSSGYYPYIHVMDDDVTLTLFGSKIDVINPVTLYKNFYDWSDQLTINPESGEEWEDKDWEKIYSHIGYLNVILAHVEKFTNDSIEIRDRIEGEARFLRGAYYYLLTNLYASPYVKETATRDMGVPLNLTEDIEDKYYTRNTMAECYQVIVEDLKVAAEKLKGVKQSMFYRANELAARILLSRVYLYMEEWQLALEECQKAMALDGVMLIDLNTFTGEERQYMLDASNPEIIFTQGYSATSTFYKDIDWYTICSFACSEELISLYNYYNIQGIRDLRMDVFFEAYDDELYKIVKVGDGKVYDCFVIRSAELYLNKAEAEAMLNKAEAVSTIKTLLSKRFEEGRIPAIDELQGGKLISFIRDERRRELCFEAHRWFDLRRYAVSSKYPERKSIKHTTYDKNGVLEGSYILDVYGKDPAWVLPIPGYEIVYNQGKLIDNPERKSRKLE
ncbi:MULTISPECIES: RagB/SusD family nutrient uptake outer membrane protein [Butyricimonas]|uniref:RagB/SusD family nutrient uptake outer membrane protein n=1 Tax=Butyricimonas TaxID=574697 RepID=UPI001D064783|nr:MULTISPECIES: RagB/SusD family nutrient uptake outer membrane protein [Butyricimonas]MCB6974425.1 RagB/SusD family nutrient uptake outer membrane protein [Butyricimonas synergistica]MCG4521211.1 RagB/SusD family nutrient uptake outer membrane protein [Butyricimonas sp. DFI.6.44]